MPMCYGMAVYVKLLRQLIAESIQCFCCIKEGLPLQFSPRVVEMEQES